MLLRVHAGLLLGGHLLVLLLLHVYRLPLGYLLIHDATVGLHHHLATSGSLLSNLVHLLLVQGHQHLLLLSASFDDTDDTDDDQDSDDEGSRGEDPPEPGQVCSIVIVVVIEIWVVGGALVGVAKRHEAVVIIITVAAFAEIVVGVLIRVVTRVIGASTIV